MKHLSFTDESFRRLLRGDKSETQRLVHPQPRPGMVCTTNGDRTWLHERARPIEESVILCRLRVGDVVAATEAYAVLLPPDPVTLYRADWRRTGPTMWQRSVEGIEEWWAGQWKSARYMPARLARIHLRILEVDARRLQAMDDADAVNEGCTGSPIMTPLEQYASEWDEINRRAPWASNPWVWRFSFERLTTTPRLPVRSRS